MTPILATKLYLPRLRPNQPVEKAIFLLGFIKKQHCLHERLGLDRFVTLAVTILRRKYGNIPTRMKIRTGESISACTFAAAVEPYKQEKRLEEGYMDEPTQ